MNRLCVAWVAILVLGVGDLAVAGPSDGCVTTFETYTTRWSTIGYFVSDGPQGLQGPGTEFVPTQSGSICDISFVGYHEAGPNEFTVWLLPDDGGCPADPAAALGRWDVSDLNWWATEYVVETPGGPCVTAGETYWLAMTANGGGDTWGVQNQGEGVNLPMCTYRYDGTWDPIGIPNAAAWRVTVTPGECGGLDLAVDGSCPGVMSATVTGATPGGWVALVYSPSSGNCTIPSGVCAGTVLDLGCAGAMQVSTAVADASGVASFSGNAPPGACGGCVQAVDAATCATSNVVCL
ncbi:MAG: hypothetical protein ACF8PN_06365 [Phycisphaerales bacterium]